MAATVLGTLLGLVAAVAGLVPWVETGALALQVVTVRSLHSLPNSPALRVVMQVGSRAAAEELTTRREVRVAKVAAVRALTVPALLVQQVRQTPAVAVAHGMVPRVQPAMAVPAS